MQICTSKTICILRIVEWPHKADVLMPVAYFSSFREKEKKSEVSIWRILFSEVGTCVVYVLAAADVIISSSALTIHMECSSLP